MRDVTEVSRPRLLLGASLLLALACFLFAAPTPAHAQEEGGEAAPAAAGEAPPTEQKEKSANPFVHIVKSAGWMWGPIFLGMSVVLVALVVLLAMEMRYSSAIPPGFVEDFTETVNKRQFKAAYDMAREDSSFLGVVLTSSMSRLQYGIEDAREAALNAVASVKAGKEQLITYLATIGTTGPMIGLVGTVWGMILAFMKLASGGQLNAELLAADISVALVTTLLGVAVALPAIFFHAMFKNRLTRLSTDAGNIADDLLTQMYHNSRKPAPAGAAETQPAPTAVRPK